MKNRLINTLMLSGIIAATLVGCNSGGNGNVANQTQLGSMGSNNQGVTSSQISNTEKIGTEGNILVDFAAATLSEYINSTVGKVVLNAITGGNENNGGSTKEMLTSIDNNFQNVESGLSGLNTTINTVFNNLESQNLGDLKTNIGNSSLVLSDNYHDVKGWIEKAGLDNGVSTDNINLAESIFAGFGQAAMNEAMTNALILSESTFSQNFTNLSDQDVYQQELTCDNNRTYNSAEPANASNSHPQTVLSNPNNECALSNLLNTEINQFALSSLKQGTNIFYTTQGFDQSLDLVYLQILTALTKAYAVDQLRLFMGLPSTNPSGNLSSIVPSVIPISHYGNYSLAESDLALAYNMRLANLQQLFSSAKAQLFNQFTSTINSNNMVNQCGLSFESIDAIEYMSQSSSDNSNQYSWDGSNLTVTCQSTPFGPIKTTTNLAALCTTANGTYNLSSSNGYIRCGAGNTTAGDFGSSASYGNYSYTNVINDPIEPDARLYTSGYDNNWEVLEEQALTYGPYNYTNKGDFNELNGQLDIKISSKSQPLVSWDFMGYNNHGQQATFEVPSSNSFAVYFNFYNESTHNTDSNWSFVDDGVHAYMISASTYFAMPIIACLPNDNNCTFASGSSNSAFVGDSSSYDGSFVGLVFSNGDAIAINQIMGHGDYQIQTFYNGAPTPFEQYSYVSTNGQASLGTTNNLLNAFPSVGYNQTK
ncbi:MAG: hypothetical protein E6Q33_09850 [Neisseriales bacterium]|nr:MAG: hypothetical protein E6Q33_09850 [Neisseriales bacterium]